MTQDDPGQLFQRAVALHGAGRLNDAGRFYQQVIAALPQSAEPLNMLGVLRMQQGRGEEGIALIGAAMRLNPFNPDIAGNYAQALAELGRFDEATLAMDQALAIQPDFPDGAALWAQLRGAAQNSRMQRTEDFAALFRKAVADLNLDCHFDALVAASKACSIRVDSAECWNVQGSALRGLKRPAEALVCFDRAIQINPDYPAAFCNRGGLLMDDLKRVPDALVDFDRALALQPDFAECWTNRGHALRDLFRLDEAMASYSRALACNSSLLSALKGRAQIFLEMNRVQEGLKEYRDIATDIPGRDAFASAVTHKQRHDDEQRVWREQSGAGVVGAAIAGPAIRRGPQVAEISAAWPMLKPQIAVIDDFLTEEALTALRLFCLQAQIWDQVYPGGYLGAFPEHGFACPLLGQIADELRTSYPAIFKNHALNYLWGFKYDSRLSGIGIHADEASVNVNFWITPDDANQDPQSGGLVVWDMAAPHDWNFDKFNSDQGAIRNFLTRHGAKAQRVPYRQNRAVIFDSDLFHETDTIRFKDGYENRRVNVTMLYGRR